MDRYQFVPKNGKLFMTQSNISSYLQLTAMYWIQIKNDPWGEKTLEILETSFCTTQKRQLRLSQRSKPDLVLFA